MLTLTLSSKHSSMGVECFVMYVCNLLCSAAFLNGCLKMYEALIITTNLE